MGYETDDQENLDDGGHQKEGVNQRTNIIESANIRYNLETGESI